MDLTQRKLTKQEWESIESPVSTQEKQILQLIMNGYYDPNIKYNENQSLFTYVKIEITPETHLFLYQKYFEEPIKKMTEKYGKSFIQQSNTITSKGLKRLKSADNIRIQNLETSIKTNMQNIFEFLLLEISENLLRHFVSKKNNNYVLYLYSLIQLKKTSIKNINLHVMEFVDKIIALTLEQTKLSNVIYNAYDFIEKNPYLLKYEDKTLFSHQKQIFSIFSQKPSEVSKSKLVLYTAPTGTGKTLTPVGLSNEYRIIFVCVARHIGLALAKSAISMEKKVAFAFGCETASDIRLHYFAAVNYVKNSRSGGIGKVDNSEGSKVEIMICDVQSYVTAMYYMLAFNKPYKIITYWDEPTITMDYKSHDLHAIIHRNWSENKIPNIVLSCATLPKQTEIQSVMDDFRGKFDHTEIHEISSFDCRKSIPILDKNGYCVLPHLMCSNYSELLKCVDYCSENKTILRYFDLSEIIRFLRYINEHGYIEENYRIESYFGEDISEITMNSLKVYYLECVKHLCFTNVDYEEGWTKIYQYMISTKVRKFRESFSMRKTKSMEMEKTEKPLQRLHSVADISQASSAGVGQASPMQASTVGQASSAGILLTTSDAYTLTDGPTIFLTEDVKKIGNFYIQQSNISPLVFQTILAKIAKNNEIAQQIEKLESLIQEKQEKTFDNTAKNQKSSTLIQKSNENKDTSKCEGRESEKLTIESQKFMEEIHRLRKEIRMVSLDPVYVPNTTPHQQLWTPTGEVYKNAFFPNIDEDVAKRIMSISIDNHLKVLLLLGIGIFMENPNIEYMEIMKGLADTQRLFIIIASSDYIYGTNYQFCHGFIGKDLKNMTQQKTIQAMGRIGRNNIQQDYTVRFRDDDMIKSLFQPNDDNLEAKNMCELFCTDE